MPDLYLLHFQEPYRHARHYLGYAVGTGRGRAYARAQAAGRLTGAHELVMAVQAAGIEITVADVWVGAGRRERAMLRRSHNLSRHCPLCLRAAESSRDAS